MGILYKEFELRVLLFYSSDLDLDEDIIGVEDEELNIVIT